MAKKKKPGMKSIVPKPVKYKVNLSAFSPMRKGITVQALHKTIEESQAYQNGFCAGKLDSHPTLRQWYAGMALQGILGNSETISFYCKEDRQIDDLSGWCFKYADSMIKAGK